MRTSLIYFLICCFYVAFIGLFSCFFITTIAYMQKKSYLCGLNDTMCIIQLAQWIKY